MTNRQFLFYLAGSNNPHESDSLVERASASALTIRYRLIRQQLTDRTMQHDAV
jgi:hypothetical protein